MYVSSPPSLRPPNHQPHPWQELWLVLPLAPACLLRSTILLQIMKPQVYSYLQLLPPRVLRSITRCGLHSTIYQACGCQFSTHYTQISNVQFSCSQTHKQEFCSKTSFWLASKVLSICPKLMHPPNTVLTHFVHRRPAPYCSEAPSTSSVISFLRYLKNFVSNLITT